MEAFDISRAKLRGPDHFKRFSIKSAPRPLQTLNLPENTELIVFERGGSRYGFLLIQMAYHHLAQGRIQDEPFMVSFCAVCHSAMGFSPQVGQNLHHFSVGGLYDGLAILVDDESLTYWNHISGEAVHGPLKGQILDPFALTMTHVNAELRQKNPAKIWISKMPWWIRLLHLFSKPTLNGKGFFPPGFRKTMADIDKRLDEFTPGLGIIINGAARFYPKAVLRESIEDVLADNKVWVSMDEDGIPRAKFEDGGIPIQLFSRWYGFVLTYPDCSIYGMVTPAN